MKEITEYRYSGNELILVKTKQKLTMKLSTFDTTNSRSFAHGKPTIRFSRPSGLVSISAEAAKIIGIKDGDKIEIHQDEESPEDFYIEKVLTSKGFKLRIKDGGEGGAAFNCSHIVHSVLKSLKIDAKSASFSITEKPVEFQGRKLFLIIKSTANTVQKSE